MKVVEAGDGGGDGEADDVRGDAAASRR